MSKFISIKKIYEYLIGPTYRNYDADAAFDRMHKRGALGMWEDEAEKK